MVLVLLWRAKLLICTVLWWRLVWECIKHHEQCFESVSLTASVCGHRPVVPVGMVCVLRTIEGVYWSALWVETAALAVPVLTALLLRRFCRHFVISTLQPDGDLSPWRLVNL